ncbi:MAG: hypothetical protein IPL39_13490 [Opitutaceae bacterium]|nr:hypothetical protein [Opitutaceae bacterium]
MPAKFSDPKKPNLAGSLDFAKEAYANAQEAIRFIDTKNAFITGLSTFASTVPISLLIWINGGELPGGLHAPAILLCGGPHHLLMVTILCITTLIGSLVILFSILSLVGRTRPSDPHAPVSILFPVQSVKLRHALSSRLRELKAGVDENFQLEEYCHQIEVVGAIIAKKIKWHRRSAWTLLAQIVATGISGVLTLVCM